MLENELKQNIEKTEALIHSSSKFQSANPLPYLSVAVKYLFLLLPEILVFTFDIT